MNVTYDRTIKIAGLSIIPWMRVGLERWFDDYKIIALEGLDAREVAHMPEVVTLDGGTRLAKKNAQNLAATERFRQLAEGRFRDYYFLPYRPVELPEWADSSRFLMADPKFTRTYENKVWLREKFSATVPFAPFTVLAGQDIEPTQHAYSTLTGQFGDKLVLQEEQSTGGKGTHFANTAEEFREVVGRLTGSGKVVVSQFVAGQERSVQCCATRYGVLVGGLQKQIIRNPQLTNLQLKPVHAFCGGEIGVEAERDAVLAKAKQYAQTIGEAMYADGYRGIFGLDVLVSGDQVTVLEINARTTGLTPLITMLSGAGNIPFYLLHVLELGNFAYQLFGPEFEPAPPGSLMILHSHQAAASTISRVLKTGVYQLGDGKLKLLRQDLAFEQQDPDDAFLLQMCAEAGSRLQPGDRLMNVLLRRHAMDANDTFPPEIRTLVTRLYEACGVA